MSDLVQRLRNAMASGSVADNYAASADLIEYLLKQNAELREALEKVLKTVPCQDGNGGFIVDHHSIDGEYLGTQQIDPMWVVQEMAAIAHNALAALSAANKGKENG